MLCNDLEERDEREGGPEGGDICIYIADFHFIVRQETNTSL